MYIKDNPRVRVHMLKLLTLKVSGHKRCWRSVRLYPTFSKSPSYKSDVASIKHRSMQLELIMICSVRILCKPVSTNHSSFLYLRSLYRSLITEDVLLLLFLFSTKSSCYFESKSLPYKSLALQQLMALHRDDFSEKYPFRLKHQSAMNFCQSHTNALQFCSNSSRLRGFRCSDKIRSFSSSFDKS